MATTLSPDGRDRPPHLRSFRDGWRHLRFLLLMCPLWLYVIPGSLLFAGGVGLLAWLTPGPRQVAGVVFDVHTMLFGALCVIVGYQTLWLGAFAKIHGWTSGLLPPGTFSPRLFRRFNLERGVLGGLVILQSAVAVAEDVEGIGAIEDGERLGVVQRPGGEGIVGGVIEGSSGNLAAQHCFHTAPRSNERFPAMRSICKEHGT